MKLAAAQQSAFLQKPDPKIRGILLYGPDEGLIRQNRQQLLTSYLGKGYDPFNVTDISAEALHEDPARLQDELSSYSLMGDKQAITLRQAANDHTETIKQALLSSPPPEWPFIATAGDLRPTSKLRKLFESEALLAAFPCYRDDARKVTQVISEELRKREIRVDPGVIQILANSMGNDRSVTIQEIEKIDLYLGEERHLGDQTARMLCGDNQDHTLDELFDAVCGAQGNLEEIIIRCYQENMQPIALFRMLNSHLQKLLSIKIALAEGNAAKSVFMRHGVFFKQEAAVQKQVNRWSIIALERAISAILDAERETKRGILPAEMGCTQLLHQLSRYAARA